MHRTPSSPPETVTRRLPGLRFAAALLTVSVAACDCGDDEGTTVIPPIDGGSGGREAIDRDAMLPVNNPDDPPTGMPPEGIVGSCGVDSNKLWELARTEESPVAAPLGVDRANSRAVFVHAAASDGCDKAIYVTEMTGDANDLDPPEPALAIDDCEGYDDPSAAVGADGLWLLAYSTSLGGNRVIVRTYDLETGELGDENVIAEGVDRVSAVAIGRLEAGRRAVVWAERSTSSAAIYTRFTDELGVPATDTMDVATVTGGVPQLGVTALGKLGGSVGPAGAIVSWWEQSGSTSRLLVRAFSLDAVAVGDARVIETGAGDLASISTVQNHLQALGVDITAGGLAYASGPMGGEALWFQLLDNEGQIGQLWDGTSGTAIGVSTPTRVVTPPSRSTHASLVRILQGYMLAFRAMEGGDNAEPRIRIAFLNPFGALQVISDVAYTTEFGGATQIVQGVDGRVTIVWSEVDPDTFETVYMAARLPCP